MDSHHSTVPRFVSKLVHSIHVMRERHEVIQWVGGREPGDVHRLVRRFVDDERKRVDQVVIEWGNELLVEEVALLGRRKVYHPGIYVHPVVYPKIEDIMHAAQELHRGKHKYGRRFRTRLTIVPPSSGLLGGVLGHTKIPVW